MKETKFIEQNKKKWSEFEELSQSKEKDSNLYSKLFIQITDDLSYARTFYSKRSVRVYLNNLAQNIFHKVFSRNRKKQSVIKDFWMEDLPSIMYHHRVDLLIAFLVTIGAVAIGLLTYKHDPKFASKILGDDYLAMTAENIAKKDPMAVYKSMNPIQMFVKIALNNLMVDIRTFFFGLIFGIGSILVLIYNGLMLAAFQFYFVKRGLFYESFLAVWLHGTLEISAMVICGAAGIVLGKGLVFPGTYSRTQAFFSSAQRATKIFFSVLPITLVAAIIESFLTRYTKAPDVLRLALILISLSFILGYFVYLPWLKKRNGTLRILEAEKVLQENYKAFDFLQIKKISEIVIDSFSIFRKYKGFFITFIWWFIILFTIVGITLNQQYLLNDIYYTKWSLYNSSSYFHNLKHFLLAKNSNLFMFIIPVFFSILSLQVSYIFYKEECQQNEKTISTLFNWIKERWKIVLLNLIVQIVFYAAMSALKFSYVCFLFLLPIQFTITYSLVFPYKNQGNFLATFFKTLKASLMNLFVINLVFYLLSIALFYLFNTLFSEIYEAVIMNLTASVISSNKAYLILSLISVSSIISFSFIFFCIYQAVFYFSQKEKNTAEGLTEQLQKIGTKTKKYVIQK